MCRIPKVVVVAPADMHAQLRRALGSLEYEIVAAVTSVDEIGDITADVVVLHSPDEQQISAARARGLKTVALGGSDGADLYVEEGEATSFKSRIWELFRPGRQRH